MNQSFLSEMRWHTFAGQTLSRRGKLFNKKFKSLTSTFIDALIASTNDDVGYFDSSKSSWVEELRSIMIHRANNDSYGDIHHGFHQYKAITASLLWYKNYLLSFTDPICYMRYWFWTWSSLKNYYISNL